MPDPTQADADRAARERQIAHDNEKADNDRNKEKVGGRDLDHDKDGGDHDKDGGGDRE